MLLLKLWNFLRGYVIIFVEGYFLERFINICTRRQILLFDVDRINNTSMTLKISIKGFKMLRPIAKKTKSRVRIISKKGMPFILNKNKKRKAFLFGALLFFVLINVVASYIWDIEVFGNTEVGKTEILEELNKLGIKPGILKYQVDVDKIANELMLRNEKLAWVGFEIKGTRALVSLKERREPPVLISKDIPCNIIAARDGLISSITVKAGVELVKAGDTVTKGQMLVTGVVPNKNEEEGSKLVHAIAEVKARTWYESSSTIKFKIMEAVRTGNSNNNYRFILFGKEIKLKYLNKMDFVNYDKVQLRKVLTIGKDFVLPFEILTNKYFENKLVERKLSIEEAKEMAYNDALKKLMNIISEDVEIINKTIDYKENNGDSITSNVTLECIENIGITKEIGGE